jgi:hypothetical protein
MLNNILDNWNKTFKTHPSVLYHNSVDVIESEENAKLKKITINVHEAISFPSKEFCSFDLFGSLSNKNCDGALLIHNLDNTYDLVFVEMKSTFSTDEVFKAKKQIVESRIKLQALFGILTNLNKFPIRKTYGIITTLSLDDDQKNYWSKLQMLPDEKLDFGWVLVKYSNYDAPVLYDNRFRLPQTMNFQLYFSDHQNLSIKL